MMTRYVYACVLVIITVMTVQCLPALDETPEEGDCLPFAYCRASAFPELFTVMDWSITCESEEVTDNGVSDCCLTQQAHYVCMGIRVFGGNLLNYSNDTNSHGTSTDFSELCHAMLDSLDIERGQYNSATFKAGGGGVAFKYGMWANVRPSEKHIHNIACGVGQD